MSIDIIVAVDLNGGIGYKGDLLIKNKHDLRRFRKLSINSSCLMGSKTFLSLPNPLINRENIIVTRDKDFKVSTESHNKYDISIRDNPLEVVEEFKRDNKRLCIIGGGNLYKQMLPCTDRVFLTLFHEQLESDTKFDMEYLKEHFVEVKREELVIDGMWVDFIDYLRKENV